MKTFLTRKLKNLAVAALVLMFINCVATKQLPQSTVDKYTISGVDVFYDGTKIGYMESVELEVEGNEFRKELTIVLFNNGENMSRAQEVIQAFRQKSNGLEDVEVKFILSKFIPNSFN